MPRMMPVDTNYIDYGNVLAKSEGIKGQGLRNALMKRQLEREPEAWAIKKRQAQQQSKTSSMEYNIEKLQVLSQLLQGATDTPSYQLAIQQYIRMFPDEIGDLKYLPHEYNKRFVDMLIKSTETAQERVAKLGYAGRQVAAAGQIESARIRAESKRKPTPKPEPKPESPIETFMQNRPNVPPEKTEKKFSAYATNPETGERVGWDGEKWVKIK